MTETRLGALVIGAFAVFACNTDNSSAPRVDLDLALLPASQSIPQGVTGSTIATLTRSVGFTGPVRLSIAGLPTGITGTVSPEWLTSGMVDATIELAVAVNVPPGPYMATVTASADGVTEATATLGLTVSESGFALSMNPGDLTIVAGGSGGGIVNITRTQFDQDVTLELVGPPAGISGTFEPTPTSTGVAGLIVDVAANTAPGTYTLAIKGTATGPRSQSTSLTVHVPSPPAGGNVVFRFCSVEETPVFVARQDGGGAWEEVAGSAHGDTTQFVFDIAQGWGGVLMVYQADAPGARRSRRLQRYAPSVALRRRTHASRTAISSRASASAAISSQYETFVVYGSSTQVSQIGLESCASVESSRAHEGFFVGVGPGEYGIASIGGVTRIQDGTVPVEPLMFDDLPAGPVDLFGTRTRPGGPANRVLIERDVDLSNAALPVQISFLGPSSSAAASAGVEIAGGSGDDLEVFTDLVTSNSLGGLWSDLAPSPAAQRSWSGLPPDMMRQGDFHSLVVFASPSGSDDIRYVQKHVIPVSFQSLALGPAIDAPVWTQVMGDPYPRFRVNGDLGTYSGSVTIEVLPPDEAGNSFSIYATGAYLSSAGNQQAYDFTMPDVTGLAGYPIASRLTTGANSVIVSGFDFTGPGIFEVQPIPGTMMRSSVRNITVIVP